MKMDVASGSAEPVESEGVAAVRIVAGAGMGMMLNLGALLFNSLGTFLIPVVQNTGWQRETVALAIAPAALGVALMQFLVGPMLDRMGARKFAAISFTLVAVSIALLGWMPSSALAFVAFFTLTGILGAGQTPTAYNYLIVTSFTRHRGLALGIVNAFSATSIMFMPMVATLAIEDFGWRGAYVMIAAGTAFLGWAAVIWLIPSPKADCRRAQVSDLQDPPTTSFILNRDFWYIASVFFLLTLVVQGAVIHLTPSLRDKGMSAMAAAGVMAVYGGSLLVSRFIVGGLLDVVSPRFVAILGSCGPLFACVLLAMPQTSTLFLYVAGGLLGFGAGSEADLLPFVVTRMFRREHLGRALGAFTAVMGIAVAIGPSVFARAQAAFGSYQEILFASAIVVLIVIMLLLLSRLDALNQAGDRPSRISDSPIR